ncbi:unnamed protein product [Rotaria magnacalcarata]
MCKLVLQKNVPLGFANLGLLATVGLQAIYVCDKLCVVVLSTDNGEIHDSNKIMLMSELKDLNIQHPFYFQCSIIYNNGYSNITILSSNNSCLNQLINYLDPRPEYIRVIIIEWLTKSSISIARTVSLDTERNLISVQRCKDLDGYSQQVS